MPAPGILVNQFRAAIPNETRLALKTPCRSLFTAYETFVDDDGCRGFVASAHGVASLRG